MFINEGPALYVTADRGLVVAEGDPRAAFLLVGAGGQLAPDEAARYGLANQQGAQQPAQAGDQTGELEQAQVRIAELEQQLQEAQAEQADALKQLNELLRTAQQKPGKPADDQEPEKPEQPGAGEKASDQGEQDKAAHKGRQNKGG